MDMRQELRECESLANTLAERIKEIRTALGVEDEPESEGLTSLSFGLRLRSLRAGMGWSQRELAEQSGVSVNGVIKLENDYTAKPRATTVARLARALKVPTRVLEG